MEAATKLMASAVGGLLAVAALSMLVLAWLPNTDQALAVDADPIKVIRR